MNANIFKPSFEGLQLLNQTEAGSWEQQSGTFANSLLPMLWQRFQSHQIHRDEQLRNHIPLKLIQLMHCCKQSISVQTLNAEIKI